jgi:CDP-glucose 4,6-dehydratase
VESLVRGSVMGDFWTNKRVLVTGHEGFLGSNLTLALVQAGAKVVGLDIRTRRKHSLFTPAEYKTFATVHGSVADYGVVKKLLVKHRIEAVFHLAAEAIVGRSLAEPVETFETNIVGTWNVLEAARKLGTVQSVVVASSDKAYGSHKKLPYQEDAALQGNHPYDASKSCADLIAHTYFHTYQVPVGITRCGNIYGPGDFNFSRILPDAMRCLAEGRTLQIRSDGKFTRDYVYVADIVSAYLLLAEALPGKKLGGEAFNVSDENPISVLKLLEKVNQLGKAKLSFEVLNQAKYEIKDQYLASQKARKTLGWKPTVTLEQGLQKTVQWYLAYFRAHGVPRT